MITSEQRAEQRALWAQMTAQREQILDSVIREVLIRERALDWIVTPARLFIGQVRRAGSGRFDVCHSDDYIKIRINAVSREMRKEISLTI